MRGLADIQASFAAALADPERPAPPALRAGAETADSTRFDIYRNNIMVGLIEGLERNFPVVRRLVGDAFFRHAARTYARHNPPRSPVLLLYGRGFGDFLDQFEAARSVPYLGDVARLEWARLDAYHAADADPLAIDRLAAVAAPDLDGLRLTLHPSLHLLGSRFPVGSIWAATSGADPATAVDMARGEDVAVLRPGPTVELRILPAAGRTFIEGLAAGRSLGAAARAAAEAHADFDLSSHLSGLFGLGAVIALETGLPVDNQPQAEK
ncbi:HvfC/BufC N-terminal domain-containing protein [Oceanibacterium hippocampi]|uniref:Putative DNA-binding domain-containing protein n=1 Tax=Oceanibacterium hippocampi TaxID=745714 RepID=A0A1Y5TUZ8_9PROT|nr:DNA-binding domain-containing protein [Oceanibacterium hippocampi]SLN73257.1 hypothetical protein OCH7691_03579 [Oceanibacterium hippocampi]